MATIRALLCEVDLSVGEVVYSPGGRLGPRHQRDVELIPFTPDMPTSRSTASHHGASGPDAPACFCPGTSSASPSPPGNPRATRGCGHGSDIDRLARLLPVLAAWAALSELMRAAVTAARLSLPPSTQVTAALARGILAHVEALCLRPVRRGHPQSGHPIGGDRAGPNAMSHRSDHLAAVISIHDGVTKQGSTPRALAGVGVIAGHLGRRELVRGTLLPGARLARLTAND
jgi:hypothetical protein